MATEVKRIFRDLRYHSSTSTLLMFGIHEKLTNVLGGLNSCGESFFIMFVKVQTSLGWLNMSLSPPATELF